jgi:hypothetical protein
LHVLCVLSLQLAEFPSAKFYNGLLQSWPKPADRPLPAGLPWPNPQVGAETSVLSLAGSMLCSI